jgi:hypothetical protein
MSLPQHQYLLRSAVVVVALGTPMPAETGQEQVLAHSYQPEAAMELTDKHNTAAELVEADLVEI